MPSRASWRRMGSRSWSAPARSRFRAAPGRPPSCADGAVAREVGEGQAVDPTREIVDPVQVGHLLAGLSVLGLLAAVGLGLASRGGSLALRRGAILGAAAVLAYPLWWIYNGIEDHYGLDSVLALLLNAALF